MHILDKKDLNDDLKRKVKKFIKGHSKSEKDF